MANDTSTTWSWSRAAMSAAGELAALAQVVCALPRRRLGVHTLGDADDHPVPVVLVHGILGDPTNFCILRRHLARNGIRRFSSFAYRPRLDYQRIARNLAAHIEQVRKETGAAQVDVISHSLGGLVARYFVQTEGGRLVRRLVTLGTPYLALHNPAQELAVFGADDTLVPPPRDKVRRRIRVIEGCGHLRLLTDGRVLDAVVRHLRPPVWAANRAADAAA
ncbi:MAG TPA: alpha/beta fold hydrolase [Candidatus Binatia bacterium]|nr:alpha/beta fold hydrolase [Candidatus Binatia bacterium]